MGDMIAWVCKPGDILGLDAFINNENNSFNAIAVEKVEACYIPRDEFKKLLVKKPAISVDVLKYLSLMLDFIDKKALQVSRKTAPSCVAQLLLSISLEDNRKEHYSISDLAGMTGVTQEEFYQLMADLSAKNILAIEDSVLRIKNVPGLSLLAAGEVPAKT